MDRLCEGKIASGSLVDIIDRGVWQNPDHDCVVVQFNATRGAYLVREMRNETVFLASPSMVCPAGSAH
ncbi:hypothetical protein ACTXM3_08515 [Glutamicibacter arilaitensis]|uniref:hypothetical protein n=1 Tax=Glutamicibacter arilaitensis TaxID=256701 RepID=UPI003FD6149F